MKIRQRLLFLLTPLALLPLLLVTIFSLFLFKQMNPATFSFYETLAVIFVLLTAVVVIVMIADAANSIAKPLRALTETARKVAGGDLEVVVQVPFHSFELEQLAEVVEKMKGEIKRQQEVIRVEAAHAAIGKMATHVAHDLASPLSSIQTSLDIFKEIPSPDKKILNSIHLLELGAKRLGAISKELLDQHKGDQSKPSLFHLSDVLEELVKEYELQESYGGVAFLRDYAQESISIYGDRVKIQRVFGNLIKNAVEAMDKCGELTLTTRVADGSVVAEIKDTGCGMSEEVLKKVLNGGFTAGKENGHGIGLSSVRKILEEHKGKLSAQSEIGIGTVFHVELPVEKGTVGKNQGIEKGYHVLVVDDDQTIRLAWELIQDRLHIEKLHLFPNLESLLESGLDLASIDIAFVDKNITNSRHDGAEVVSHLKSRGVAKVVLASGESEKQLREDPAFSQADFIVGEKIPSSFKEFFS